MILTYILYIFLLIYSFIKIDHRIKHIIDDHDLNEVLYINYNVLSIIKGPYSFFGLLFLTVIPMIHFTGYFFVYAFLSEYSEKNILNTIINHELITFKKEMEENSLHNLFVDNNRCRMLERKIKGICDYFTTNTCYDNLFVFYQFLSLKTSIHHELERLKKKAGTEDDILNQGVQTAIKIDKAINSTFTIMKKHEVPYDIYNM